MTILLVAGFQNQSIAQTALVEEYSSPNATVLPEQLFPDLGKGNPYYLAIKYLKEQQLIHGYPDGLFRPNQHINRAEALKILVGAMRHQQYQLVEKPLHSLNSSPDTFTFSKRQCQFPDLQNTEWYFSYVCNALTNGTIQGYPDGLFRPEQTINRAEALKIITLHSGLTANNLEESPYSDTNPQDWFFPYAQLSKSRTWIVPTRDNQLLPANSLTRGEFALIVYRTIQNAEFQKTFGRATYYAGRFEGQSTANGENFSNHEFTAAHKTLPFGSKVQVTNLANGKSITVRINDRGPYVPGAIIDLSSKAFAEIAPLSSGIANVEINPLPNSNE